MKNEFTYTRLMASFSALTKMDSSHDFLVWLLLYKTGTCFGGKFEYTFHLPKICLETHWIWVHMYTQIGHTWTHTMHTTSMPQSCGNWCRWTGNPGFYLGLRRLTPDQKTKILEFCQVHLRLVTYCQMVKMKPNGFQKLFLGSSLAIKFHYMSLVRHKAFLFGRPQGQPADGLISVSFDYSLASRKWLSRSNLKCLPNIIMHSVFKTLKVKRGPRNSSFLQFIWLKSSNQLFHQIQLAATAWRCWSSLIYSVAEHLFGQASCHSCIWSARHDSLSVTEARRYALKYCDGTGVPDCLIETVLAKSSSVCLV